jgi:urease gamma subunit
VLRDLAEKEKISIEKVENLVGEYLYTQKLPQDQEVADLLPAGTKFLHQQGIIDRVKNMIQKIVDVFEW